MTGPPEEAAACGSVGWRGTEPGTLAEAEALTPRSAGLSAGQFDQRAWPGAPPLLGHPDTPTERGQA